MGFFSRIGKGIKKAVSGVGKAVTSVVRAPLNIASSIVRAPLGIVGGILGRGRGSSKFVPPQPPVPATPPIPPVPNGTVGNGADLWKFSKSEDKWNLVLGTPKKVTVNGVEYDWKTNRGISYYAKPIPIPPTPLGNTAGVGVQSSRPLTKEDAQISFEQLISGLHFYYEESNFRGNQANYNGINNYAFLAYLAAREVFGNETPIIEGLGTTKKLRQWYSKIKFIGPRIKEDAIIRVLNIIGEDIVAGGNGYLNNQTKMNGVRTGFFGSNRNAKNFREAIETSAGNGRGNILINYDDLLQNITRMSARDEFIMTRQTSIRNVLRKAWEKRPGSSKRANRRIKDRTLGEWKNAIDKEIRGNGIKKTNNAFGFASAQFAQIGNSNSVYDETWMDLMILLNASARAKRKTGNGLVANQNGIQ